MTKKKKQRGAMVPYTVLGWAAAKASAQTGGLVGGAEMHVREEWEIVKDRIDRWRDGGHWPTFTVAVRDADGALADGMKVTVNPVTLECFYPAFAPRVLPPVDVSAGVEGLMADAAS